MKKRSTIFKSALPARIPNGALLGSDPKFLTHRGITVSTIHGVKGAEYDTVIAYALLEGMVSHFNDNNKVENSKKMLYVIGSRARKHLHLISERGRLFGYNPPTEYPPTSVLNQCIFSYD
jgi:superfamily I DNA/RNA helicase